MTNEELTGTVLDFQARLIAYEDVMKALYLKVATDSTTDNKERLQWIMDVFRSMTAKGLVSSSSVRSFPDDPGLGEAVSRHTELFFGLF